MRRQKCNSTTRMFCCALAGCFASLGLIPMTAIAKQATPSKAAALTRLNAYYGWINSPWVADDRPYQRLRDEIERRLTQGQQPVALQTQCKLWVVQQPLNPQSQFAYYYATYKLATMPGSINSPATLQPLNDLYIKVGASKLPNSYNYARLVFLCDMIGFSNPEMKGIGLRLVRHNPSDYDVKFYMTSLLETSLVSADRALALSYAVDLTQRYPKKPSAYSLLASIHYQAWRRNKNPIEGKMAIAGYQKYLQLSPSGYQFRKRAQEAIAEIQH